MDSFPWREVKGRDMFSKAFSAAIDGIDAKIISIEVDVSDGLPIYDMVGYLSSEVREAKERVKIAIKNSKYELCSKRITVNLSPADIRKEGTGFDLSIAIGILASYGYVSREQLDDTLLIGELSLNGEVCRLNGVLPIVNAAKKYGFRRVIVPKGNAREGAIVGDGFVYGVSSLIETVDFLNGKKAMVPTDVDVNSLFTSYHETNTIDFADISGQESAKRAVEIAVSGLHNILLIGPPGSGKTMIAQRVPTIMPSLSLEESMEITKIYSVSGELSEDVPLLCKRPFRSPHHTIPITALTGGGRTPKPGEISLAHLGVLFLDELPEFQQRTLEVLRQPLEERSVLISRLNATYRYPASFMLIAAMNPCKCGYYPDRNRCSCTLHDVKNYLGKISHPLLDRIDIAVEAMRIHYKDLKQVMKEESSQDIRKRVEMAQKIQAERYQKEEFRFNAFLPVSKISKYCYLNKEEQELLEEAYEVMHFSARAYHRILKVSRTIADLDSSERILAKHISEAILYRSIDKKYWGEE